MMTLFLKMVLLTVSWSFGWKIIVSKGMLLEKIGFLAEEKVKAGNKRYDIFICPWCLPNIHGLLFVWPLAFGLGIMPFEWNYKYLLIYPFCVGLSCFITGIIWSLYETMNAKKEKDEWAKIYYENAQKYYYNKNKEIKEKNGKPE